MNTYDKDGTIFCSHLCRPRTRENRGASVKSSLLRQGTPGTLLARLINTPELVLTVRDLPTQAFSTLVQHIGLEDAGEIIALATTDQLVAAFDEDLFVNTKPGERESFDSTRFVIWLEVLLEAGDEVAANRLAELSEDFVVQALSSLVLVLDNDALYIRMGEWGEDAIYAEKAIESSHSEEIDGYLLVSRIHNGWDAVIALILALDRDHRPLLVRILDRCADIASKSIEDIDGLLTALSDEESLAEDVEAEREDRRGKQGYVEPRAARSFLALAREPLTTAVSSGERDHISKAYFRDFERPFPTDSNAVADSPNLVGLPGTMGIDKLSQPSRPTIEKIESVGSDGSRPLVEAMRLLNDLDTRAFNERLEELEYLSNVLVAGAGTMGKRFRSADAAEAVLATVSLGAELEAQEYESGKHRAKFRATPSELCHILRTCRADLLFRKASSTLVAQNIVTASIGFLCSHAELDRVLEQFGAKPKGK